MYLNNKPLQTLQGYVHLPRRFHNRFAVCTEEPGNSLTTEAGLIQGQRFLCNLLIFRMFLGFLEINPEGQFRDGSNFLRQCPPVFQFCREHLNAVTRANRSW